MQGYKIYEIIINLIQLEIYK